MIVGYYIAMDEQSAEEQRIEQLHRNSLSARRDAIVGRTDGRTGGLALIGNVWQLNGTGRTKVNLFFFFFFFSCCCCCPLRRWNARTVLCRY